MSSAADQGSQKRKRGRPRKRSKLSAGRDTSPQSSSQSSEYDGPPRTRRRTVSKTTASKKQADSPPSQDNILKNDAADTRDTLTKSGSTTSLKSRLKSSASTASTPAAAVSGKRVTRKSVNVSFSENVNDTPGTNTRSSTRLQNNSNVSATQAEGDGNSRRSSARLNKGVAPSPSATSAESPESNRRVSTRSQKAAVPASSVAEVTSKVIDSEPASQEVQESFQVKNPTANRPWARKGKEPARSPSPVRTRRQRGSNVAQAIVETQSDGADEADVAAGAENSDDDIDEGSIHDSDVRSAEFEKQYDPVNDDKKIQSSTGHESKGEGQTTNTSRTETLYDPLRPWRIRGFTTAMRAEQERMYNREERYTLAGGWACTEEYQKLKVCKSQIEVLSV
ncbi:hypothetical protein K470DRAFT_100337 [Piedraia hortae CBS 480.64]|uniref:Uncharacterized protein n=1 Tax=Piedraia hortae CBS 480.64 TaxID=1314780 RepID=A0A6A7BWK6_9PEZI|nr:hypothetical protein K470DRAFT_100337 [Piedraia hortae CBS 480.64]